MAQFAEGTPEQQLRWALKRLDWYTVGRLADALEKLGGAGVAELRKIVDEKHQRAVERGTAYVPHAVLPRRAE